VRKQIKNFKCPLCNTSLSKEEELEKHLTIEKHFGIPFPNIQEKKFAFGLGNLDAEKIDFYNNVFYLFPIIDSDPLLTFSLSKEDKFQEKN
jgi:hypothetical protein